MSGIDDLMLDCGASSSANAGESPVVAGTHRLSKLDAWLPAWIGLAMIVGLLLGRFVPALSHLLARLEVRCDRTSANVIHRLRCQVALTTQRKFPLFPGRALELFDISGNASSEPG